MDIEYFYCVYVLEEETVVIIQERFTENFNDIQSGDLITAPLESQGYEKRSLIVLGWGHTREEAKMRGEVYFKRVAKWDGVQFENQPEPNFVTQQCTDEGADSDVTYFSEGERDLQGVEDKEMK